MHPSLPMKQWRPGGTERFTHPGCGAVASLSVAMPAWMVTNSLGATAAIVAATFAGLIAAPVMLHPSPFAPHARVDHIPSTSQKS